MENNLWKFKITHNPLSSSHITSWIVFKSWVYVRSVIWKSIMHITGPRNTTTKYINNRNTRTQVPKNVNKTVYRRVICIKPRMTSISTTAERRNSTFTARCHVTTTGKDCYYMQDTGEPHKVQWKKRGAKEHIPYDSIYIKTHAN